MKLGIFLGLTAAAIGGAAYAHKRRGGTFSMDSIKDSLNAAKAALRGKFGAAKEVVKNGVANGVAPASTGYSEYTIKGDRELH